VLGVQACGNTEGVFTADRDQRVEPLLLEIGENSVDAALDLVGVGT
jgi:hypothetical protein